MHRITIFVMCSVLCAAAGCEQLGIHGTSDEPMSMADLKKPGQPVQMKQLEPFIGTWEGTAEVVAPEGSAAASQPSQTYKGGGVSEWTLDGMAMKSTGWHDMPNGQRATYIEYVTWDSDAGKFKSYFVSDWGETGTGWMWADPAGQKFHWTGTGSNAMGQSSSMSGTSTLVDNDTMRWNFVERGPMGRMEMTGTSKRVK